MSPSHSLQEIGTELVRSAPPVAVTTAMIAGISVSDWAAILTILYVALQIFFLLRKQFFQKNSSDQDVVKKGEDQNDS